MSALVIVVMLGASQAQAPDTTTQSGGARATYEMIKRYVLGSAEKMPAEHFAFEPTPEVRNFGEVLAHIADANYLLCSPALGEANPNGGTIDKIEKEQLAREALVDRLKTTFAYCDKAYAALSDANAGDVLPFFSGKRTRLGLLWFHISHAFEHYGNLVTYMRLKGVVPPSSTPRPSGE